MPARPERRDAAEHRKLILKTAESLFNEYGVNEVSMHQIAKTAGIGQGTLYRRYAHKGDLCLDMIQEFSRSFIKEIDSYLQTQIQKTAEERLGVVLDMWIDTIEKKSDLLMTIDAHQLKTPEENRAANFFQSPLYQYMRGRISELLSEITAERASASADPVLAAHALICSMAPHGYFHIKKEKGYTTRELKNNYRHMCGISLHPPET